MLRAVSVRLEIHTGELRKASTIQNLLPFIESTHDPEETLIFQNNLLVDGVKDSATKIDEQVETVNFSFIRTVKKELLHETIKDSVGMVLRNVDFNILV